MSSLDTTKLNDHNSDLFVFMPLVKKKEGKINILRVMKNDFLFLLREKRFCRQGLARVKAFCALMKVISGNIYFRTKNCIFLMLLSCEIDED